MTATRQSVQTPDGGPATHAVVPLLVDYLEDVAARTALVLGDVAGVAVTLGLDAVPVTVGASSALALEVDLLQYEIGVGPCLHALSAGELMYVPDLAGDDRWRDYGPRAAALGAACCVSVPVSVRGRTVAVLKVYSARVDGLDHRQRSQAERAALDVTGGLGLALHLTRQARELDDRAEAMDGRRVIDLALGMLMERNHCSADAAFALLRRYSQHFNVRLRDAAAQVVGEADPGADTSAPFTPGRST